MIQIRPSQLSDLDRLMEIFDHARKFMASVGNGNQWINGYPQRELIAKEITDGHCYACEDEHGKIVGTFCFVRCRCFALRHKKLAPDFSGTCFLCSCHAVHT